MLLVLFVQKRRRTKDAVANLAISREMVEMQRFSSVMPFEGLAEGELGSTGQQRLSRAYVQPVFSGEMIIGDDEKPNRKSGEDVWRPPQ